MRPEPPPSLEAKAPPLRRSRFVSFDGFVSLSTWHQRPDRYRQLAQDLGAAPRISRGAGCSYAAASFGAGVIVQEMSAFDRLLDFDGKSALRVEAGASVGRVSAWAAEHGLHLPVLPGYPAITVGGCIAADVHGKNPARDGTFADWVEALTLYHPRRGFHSVARDTNPELLAATCGGFGLTGAIVDATLRLAPMPGENIAVESVPVNSFEETLEAFAKASSCDLLYAWHRADGQNGFGAGIVFQGSWTHAKADGEPSPHRLMAPSQRARWPWSLWNALSISAANKWFAARALRTSGRVQTPFEAAFPFAQHTAYHRLFGAPGLAEVQLLVPSDAVARFVSGAAELVRHLRPPLVLISTRPFRGRQSSLSMTGSGILFTFDFSRTGRTGEFLAAFDELTLNVKAQPNIGKDSRLPAAVAAATLPGYGRFEQAIKAFDPDRLHQSELSRRIGL